MIIEVEDPRQNQVADLLREHLADMAEHSPPQSIHALDIDGLCAPDITFWTVRGERTLLGGGALLGCGALLELDATHGEIKSMRTAWAHRRKGVAAAILQHIITTAQQRGYTRLSLETGSMDAFGPARALYEQFGFTVSDPFANYVQDPNSVFMTLTLG